MRPLSLRSLTSGEIALATEMFGAGIDAGRVRILAIPLWNRAFVAGPGSMVWPAGQAWDDFSAAPVAIQGVFVHELTHIWQAQNGIGLLRAKLRAGDRAESYLYDLDGEGDFASLNIEQQAMVTQHAFLASRGAETPYSAARYAALASGWRDG